MRVLWRISNHNDLSGIGGERNNGRWHTHGRRIVYLSEHPALALIEILVNLKGNSQVLPDRFQLLKIAVHDVPAQPVERDSLPPNWKDDVEVTRRLGDAWLTSRSSALLAVPSAPCPESTNYLFNPLHEDAKHLVVESDQWVEYDRRLFRIR